MRLFRYAAIAIGSLALASCMAPVGPVEVTRFHRPEAASVLGHGTFSVAAAPGMNADSLEIQTYQRAVARELVRIGYQEVAAGSGAQVALVRLHRLAFQPAKEGGPVSVGGGASVGSHGSGVGLGIGIDLSGPPPAQVITELGVMIQDRANGTTLWEGRANFTVQAKSPLAQTQLGASKMAEAMFAGFPGNDGETVEIQ